MANSLNKYFEKNVALSVIKNTLAKASTVRIATAYFETSGYALLESSLRGKEVKLIVGRPERGIESVKTVLNEFIESIDQYTGKDRIALLDSLRSSLALGKFCLGVDVKGEASTLEPKYYQLHAKIYIADKKKALVSSSNMTWSGLYNSIEAAYVVKDKDDVVYYVEKFDEYFALAEDISADLLELLENYLNLHHPFIIYARSLLRLYDIEGYSPPGTLPELADYQKPIVSRLLRTMEDYRGAMLVASTGLGKTVIASHLLAYLRMNGSVDSAIILCPAGLKSMWRDYIRRARVSGDVFSYYLLSIDDWRKFKDIVVLERELKNADGKTLILFDESHHLRNSLEGTELKLRNKRVIDVVGNKAKVLIMTATPYSKDVSDINSQLELLPKKLDSSALFFEDEAGLHNEIHWEVSTPSMISEIPPCTVLTTPSVVKYYSKTDEDDNRYVVFSGNEKRYFPYSIMLNNIEYKNNADDFLKELLCSDILYKKEGESTQGSLFEGIISGRRDPLLEARVVHQGCSSLGEFRRLALKLGRLQGEGYEKLQFQNQEKLSTWASKTLVEIDSMPSEVDNKIVCLANIINKHYEQKEKVVVFCHYIETAKYIKREIEKLIQVRIETNADKEADAVEEIIDRFAPVSNIIARGETILYEDESFEELDVLVATGALAEGFNFQDANVLVNFDLPWTVLSLAQRMGRILRPWKNPRVIYVYTMIPSTMSNNSIVHALNWKHRLDNQNSEMSSFLELPTMVGSDGKDGVVELVSLAKSMQALGDQKLDLDEVLNFIKNTEKIESNSFVSDLASIAEVERYRIKRLPPSIKAVLKTRKISETALYVLIRYKNRYFPSVFNKDGTQIMDHFRTDDIMTLIHCSRDYEESSSPYNIEDIDEWIKVSLDLWARKYSFEASEVHSDCSMVLYRSE